MSRKETVAAKRQRARQFLQHKSAMIAQGLTPVDYLCVQMGIPITEAERLIHEVEVTGLLQGTEGQDRDSYSDTQDRDNYSDDDEDDE